MSELILTNIDVQDLVKLLAAELRPLLIDAAPVPTVVPEKFLSRAEVAAMLQITLPTLDKQTRSGKLKGYRFGRRIRYKQHEIEKSLIPMKTA